MLTAISSGLVNCAFLVSMQFRSETVYLWTGFGPLVWNELTWTGLGTILGIGIIEEGNTPDARGMTINLSGIDPVIVPEVLEDYMLGGDFAIYLAAFGSDGSVIADPILCWAGRMDKPTVKVDGKTANIAIALETRLLDMNVSIDRRRTNDDQTQLVPGDVGFQFCSGVQEITLLFGTTQTTTKNI
jgi:hypothetical protein